MNNPIVKKIVNYVDDYIKYLMCVFAFFTILGTLIPTTFIGLPYGNYFGMKHAVKAILAIVFAIVCVAAAFKFRKYFGAVSLVAALLVLIIAGISKIEGVSTAFFGGGVKMVKWARVWLFVTALFNSASIAVKTFIFHDTEA